MSCDSTDRYRAHHYAQVRKEKSEKRFEECLCDCAVVDSLKSHQAPGEISSSHEVSNIIPLNPKRNSL